MSIVKPDKENISAIKEYLSKTSVSEQDVIYFEYALGYIYNHEKLYSDAFKHFNNANTCIRKTIDYDSKQHSSYVDNLIEVYSKDFFKRQKTLVSDSELPVFIVGMPRSGTSLVEQILSSHSEIYGAGELSILNNVEKQIEKKLQNNKSYPECILSCDDEIKKEFSREYLDNLFMLSNKEKRVTDKMPSNFLRIGLIKVLFPKARIIHCQRNALDTCASIYLNFINIKGNEYSFDLLEIGNYYLDYLKLMDYWNSLFPNEIYNIEYEKLIENQAGESRELINYIGLDWDDNCLNYSKNDRVVTTASTIQVRKPIYKKSVNRWKLYEKELEPLTMLLGNIETQMTV